MLQYSVYQSPTLIRARTQHGIRSIRSLSTPSPIVTILPSIARVMPVSPYREIPRGTLYLNIIEVIEVVELDLAYKACDDGVFAIELVELSFAEVLPR